MNAVGPRGNVSPRQVFSGGGAVSPKLPRGSLNHHVIFGESDPPPVFPCHRSRCLTKPSRMRTANLSKVARVLCAMVLPLMALALTGRVVEAYTVKNKSATTGFGWIAVQYNANKDAACKTQWRLVDAHSASAWGHVRGRTSAFDGREVFAGRYMIEFKMTASPSPHTPPPPVRVDVVNQKVTTYYIKYP